MTGYDDVPGDAHPAADAGPAPAGPVPIRPASTVMLVRDGARGLEVFTLRRVAHMAFAGGMTVFPGGGVDPSDADEPLPWSGPEPAWWARQWRIDPDAARTRVVAAVRELFEETGVLLTGPGVPDRSERTRLAVAGHRISLAALLRQGRQHLRADLLKPWARWVTPPGQTRRYDTYFFLAALPEGQQADSATPEAVDGGWYRPAQVLEAGEAGRVGLMPPTLAMLTDLAAATDVDELFAAPRRVTPVTPQVLSADGEVLRVRVGDREYSTGTAHRAAGSDGLPPHRGGDGP